MIEISTLIQLATLVSVLVGVIGLLYGMRAHRRQVNAKFLLEYTDRVDNLMRTVSPSIWAPNVFPANEAIPEIETRLGVMRCLNTIAQLHAFCRIGYIPKRIWKKSQSQFVPMLRSPLFIREWKRQGILYANEPSFYKYVESVQQTSGESPEMFVLSDEEED